MTKSHMQYLTRNMLNYLTFWVGAAAMSATAFIIRVLYCGGIVKEYTAEATPCNCKITLPMWIGCNELQNADTIQLLSADDENDPVLISQTPVTIN